MTVRNLATLDRDIFQPLGRILQEAFADGLIATGTIARTKTVSADPADGLGTGQFLFTTILTAPLVSSVIVGAEVRLMLSAGVTALGLSFYANAALRVRIDEVGNDQPNLSNACLHGISLEYYVDDTAGVPEVKTPIQATAGGCKWNGLFAINNPGDCGEAVCSSPTTQDDAGDYRIPVFINAHDLFYLRAYKIAQ